MISSHLKPGFHFLKNDISVSRNPISGSEYKTAMHEINPLYDTTPRLFLLNGQPACLTLEAAALEMGLQADYSERVEEMVQKIHTYNWGFALVSCNGHKNPGRTPNPAWRLLASLTQHNIPIPLVCYAEELDTREAVCLMKSGMHDILIGEVDPAQIENCLTRAFAEGQENWIKWRASREFRLHWQSLSSREMEVTQYVLRGWASRDIAKDMSVSLKTIETHRANILKKTHSKGTMDLYRQALAAGVIDADIIYSDPQGADS